MNPIEKLSEKLNQFSELTAEIPALVEQVELDNREKEQQIKDIKNNIEQNKSVISKANKLNKIFNFLNK